jgi:anti-sigma-K factor RskA
MTSDRKDFDDEERDLLAGEYVLGLSSDDERLLAEALLASDDDFAARVTAWEARCQTLFVGPGEHPSAGVWDRIAAQIGGDGPVVAANDNRWWRRAALGSFALSLLLGAVLAWQTVLAPPAPVPAAGAPPLVAALSPAEGPQAGEVNMTASYDPGRRELLLTNVSVDSGALYPELWLIPADGKARSLGMLARRGVSRVAVPPAMHGFVTAGAKLAITPEPAGGAPGGVATGPVIAIGDIRAI